MMSMTAKAWYNQYWFEKVCFESDTNGFCSNILTNKTKLLNAVLLSYRETSQRCPWQPKSGMICTDLNRSALNIKPTVSAAIALWWWHVSMLTMTTRDCVNRYWFEKVCFKADTNGFCSNPFLIVKLLNAVHGNQTLWSSVLIWRSLLRIWNQRFLQQRCSDAEPCQCCPWKLKLNITCTDLKRSASNFKPTVSPTNNFMIVTRFNVVMTTKT